MTNYITAQELRDITGITGEEVGESGSDTTIRDARITEAQQEFEKDVSKEFTGSESDYEIAQRAVAYLAAHKLRLRKISLLPSTSENISTLSSPFHKEYKRLLNLLRTAEPEEKSMSFDGKFEVTEIEDRYSSQSDETFDDMG